MKYLIDTSFGVAFPRQRPGAAEAMAEVAAGGVAVSWATVAELYEGAYRSARAPENLAMLDTLLGVAHVLLPDLETARIFGREAARLAQTGARIPDMDLIIGATAMRHGLTLATTDLRHFRGLPDLEVREIPAE